MPGCPIKMNKKTEQKKPNRNELATLTTCRELLQRVTKAQKVFLVANLPCINRVDTKFECYTLVHKCNVMYMANLFLFGFFLIFFFSFLFDV